ncbi:histidine triad nucleotide-binding protein, partial [Streptomyces sp. WAC 06725]|uniref:HIT domain-containing protein n=1 Tax=Streptomyces sp. WAC 06725 TaxID=2203209 RepID=UPI000F74529F
MAGEAQGDCLFCKIVGGKIPATVVRETETTVAFRDINPQAPTHVLVIPKVHHPDAAALAVAEPTRHA